MADEFAREYVNAVLDLAEDRIETAVKDFRESAKGLPFGARRPSDEEFMQKWQGMVARYPVQPCLLPSGTMVMESPWVLLLAGAENGNEWLSRYRRMVRRMPMEAI